MASGKVVVNLATGLEDPERVTVAFLVGTAVLEQGRQVTIVPDQGGSALGLPGHAEAVACDGCPPLPRLVQQYTDGGGELLVCPICFNARKARPGPAEREREAGRLDAALGVDRRRGQRSSATDRVRAATGAADARAALGLPRLRIAGSPDRRIAAKIAMASEHIPSRSPPRQRRIPR